MVMLCYNALTKGVGGRYARQHNSGARIRHVVRVTRPSCRRFKGGSLPPSASVRIEEGHKV
jgi:hypothetical protein